MSTTNNSIGLRATLNADVRSSAVYMGIGSDTTIVSSIPITMFVKTRNLGMKYSAGALTICSADGSDLSESNPAFYTYSASAFGGSVAAVINNNAVFTDGPTGMLTGARFGITASVDWDVDMPFYIYAVRKSVSADDRVPTFMISRNPAASITPASTRISTPASIVNTGVNDFFCWENIVKADYALIDSECIGSFRMRFSGSTNSWTIQPLGPTDGFAKYNDSTLFSMAIGQNGAAAGTYILSNAGTEPQWTTSTPYYYLNRNGEMLLNYAFSNCSVAGVGGNALQFVIPAVTTALIQTINSFDTTAPLFRAGFGNTVVNGTTMFPFLDSGSQMTNATFTSNSNFICSGLISTWDTTP